MNERAQKILNRIEPLSIKAAKDKGLITETEAEYVTRILYKKSARVVKLASEQLHRARRIKIVRA
jgi:hypothetical protein